MRVIQREKGICRVISPVIEAWENHGKSAFGQLLEMSRRLDEAIAALDAKK